MSVLPSTRAARRENERYFRKPLGHHHADRFQDEHPSQKNGEKLVLGEHRAHPQTAAQRERANIAHEDLRRVGVVPEEADPGADHGAAVDRYFANIPDGWDV